jgi:hypothetical protein
MSFLPRFIPAALCLGWITFQWVGQSAQSNSAANALRAALSETSTPTDARGICVEEALLCSSVGEVLYQWKCEDIENRLEVFKKLEQQAMLSARGMPSGRFHRVSMDLGDSRVLIQIQPTYKLLVRSALPAASNTNNGASHE